MTLKKLAWFDLGLLAIFILAGRAALLVHEVGGHAFPAWLFGLEEITIRMSPLGGGHVSHTYPADRPPGPGVQFVVALGGIFLNLVTGVASWGLGRRIRRKGWLALGSLSLGIGSVGAMVIYLANGLYYGSGDPTGLAPVSRDISSVQWMWVLLVPVGAGVGWLAARHYADALSDLFAVGTPGRSIGWTAATAGVAGLAYGGLWLGLRDSGVEGSTRQWRLEREVAWEETRRASVPKPDPGVPPAPAPKPVRPQEVAHRVPPPIGPWILYGVALASILASLWTARPSGGGAEFRPGPAFLLAGTAAAAVAAFWCWG